MKLIAGITLVAAAILLIFIGPVFSIMALNTLFGAGIELKLGSWFAMVWVHMMLLSSTVKKG